MNCNCCEHLHKASSLSAAGLLTVSNATNVGSFDKFCLLLTINPNTVITGAPVAYTVTINGTATPIVNIWGYPVTTDVLRTRKIYHGRYVIVNDVPHVTLVDAPCDEASVAAAVAMSTSTSEGEGS